MYRLLTINRVSIENFRLAVYGHKKHVGITKQFSDCGFVGGIPDTNLLFLQPSKYKTVNNDYQKAAYCHLQQTVQSLQPKELVVQNQGFAKIVGATNKGKSMAARSQSSTTTNLETRMKIKKIKKPKFSKYVEVLEVTDTAANDSKSRVKCLNARKLQRFIARTQEEILRKISMKCTQKMKTKPRPNKSSFLAPKVVKPIAYKQIKAKALDSRVLDAGYYADKPMIFLGQNEELATANILTNPEQIQQILKSFHNFRDIIESLEYDRMENDTYSVIAPTHGAEESIIDTLDSIDTYISSDIINDSVTKSRHIEAKVTEKTTPRFKSKFYHNEIHEQLAKARAIRLNLTTYLNVCVSIGLQNRGLSTVLAYRERSQKLGKTNNLITIDLYNILLHGYAEKGSFDRMNDIFALINEDGLEFNEQTFAAIFECMGRLNTSPDNIDKLKMYIKKAEDMNMTLNQIVDKSKFTDDQRDIVLSAIRRVVPDFEPIYTPPVLEYNNCLLNSLNEKIVSHDDQAINRNERVSGAEIMNSKLGYKKHQLEEMAREQMKIEMDGYITIKSVEKPKEFSNAEYCREKLRDLEKQWNSEITSAVTRDLNTLKSQVRYKPQNCMNYYTYLKALDASEYTDIIIKEILKLAYGSEAFSPTVNQLHRELGQKVQQRYLIQQKKKNGVLEKFGDIYSAYCDVWDHANTSDNTRQIWQKLVHKERASGPSMDIIEVAWPSNILSGVGRFLYNILIRDVKIDAFIMRQNQKTKNQNLLPAFYTLFRNQCRVVKEEVKPHPILARLLRASRQQTLTFDSNLVPMLCPPQPWSTPYNGGYLLNKSELIRLPQQAIQQWERIKSTPPKNIYPALDSLNQLASVPWRVNTDILDVIIEVFQNGGDSQLDVPQPPSSLPPLKSTTEKDSATSIVERAKLFKEQMYHKRKQAEMYSLWCDTLYRISLANHYRDKVFWLPHNMDFRGRVYPIPPHLNHLGSDLARSILVFDQPQPLGVDGFSWLKLHCINLTGLMKRESIRERLLYAEEVMSEILDSADNPLTGRKWWTKSDDPWQTLACCMEIAKVYRSPNPEEYLSRFPIHQDGSCNGLQHYAALGRDQAGAISVNLTPSPVPKDVYSAVVALVEKTRKKDAENGLHVAQALDGFVKRKVIKQTVMTTVYGVTRYGARLQIARQLKDIDDFPKDCVWPAASYLTTKTFESLREMFTSTRQIQDWFTDCARLISVVCGRNVEWITPLGLPVVQPYNKQEIKYTQKEGMRVFESTTSDMYEKPNILKQKNAFPPNFIHSLDSSHMMLTSLHCERKGLTFISVHDCFWTHACTVPQLNKICREQFVALHSQPILEDLSHFLKENFCIRESDFFRDDNSTEVLAKRHLNRILCQVPQKGDFDLRDVLNSVYFFS